VVVREPFGAEFVFDHFDAYVGRFQASMGSLKPELHNSLLVDEIIHLGAEIFPLRQISANPPVGFRANLAEGTAVEARPLPGA